MKLRGFVSVFVVVFALLLGSASAQSGSYLGLGDSVTFGFINFAGFEYVNAQNFVGYPDWTTIALGFTEANAACPGETTGSFISTQAPDNGCREYRSLAPLHVNYGSAQTQLQYALNYLPQHGNTALVTIELGANDVLLLEQNCNNNPQCIQSGLPGVLATAGANMATILAALRADGYLGPILVANYYSTDYSNQTLTQITLALNAAVTAPAPLFGAQVVDVFSAFQAATQPVGGRTCVAGLLNPAPGFNSLACDVHPSQSGQKLIAQTVVNTFLAASSKAKK
jgi:lysophospholipase L1-like esterase